MSDDAIKKTLNGWLEEAEVKVKTFSRLRLPTDLEQVLLEEHQEIITLIKEIEALRTEALKLADIAQYSTRADIGTQAVKFLNKWGAEYE